MIHFDSLSFWGPGRQQTLDATFYSLFQYAALFSYLSCLCLSLVFHATSFPSAIAALLESSLPAAALALMMMMLLQDENSTLLI